MRKIIPNTFQNLLEINRGHFLLESGLHGDVWFDLEKAFIKPDLLRPFSEKLANILSQYDLSMICGALVSGAFIAYSIADILRINFVYTERIHTCLSNKKYSVNYKLPTAICSIIKNKRIGIIDDVINAGSAVTKTYHELKNYGANPVVMASILTVGGIFPKTIPGEYPPIVSLEHLESNLWNPSDCPLCKSGKELIDPYREEKES